ncbi:MAG: colanic acid biosynthesis glycosyltransferase WcaL [Acidimicrobiia bacterium]|nr:colanic acid biosynthesis glycosyltransferase WcaL [Acidimicrobiia bacterium]
MRIAFVIERFPALSETFLLNQITGLIDLGHDVEIIAMGPGDAEPVHRDVGTYDLLSRTYYAPPVDGERALQIRTLGTTGLRALRSRAAATAYWQLLRHRGAGSRLHAAIAAAPFIGRPAYDVVHCHFGPMGLRVLPLREAGLARGRLVTTFYGYDVSLTVAKHGTGVYGALFEQADACLALSELMRRQLVALGCDERRARVHHIGIDCARFPYAPRSREPHAKIRVVTVGRLVEKKGIEYGIQAMARLAAARGDLEYAIVGDGPLRGRLAEAIAAAGGAGSVTLLGPKRQDEIVEILQRAHLFIAPSVTGADGNQEGTPTVLMEAMALGLPVVSTWHSAIPELVQDGVSGFLVPERDVDALAGRVGWLADHPEAWPGFGRAGRAHVEASYSIRALNVRLAGVYEELVGRAPVRVRGPT